jgi:hypothetical protein
MNSSPERDDTLSWERLEKILTQALTELKLVVVIFAGGEPLLLGETLYKAIRLCKQHGVMTRIVTNAYWATSPKAALAKLKLLREAGLDELNISTDDYHLPFIKLQNVKYAYDAARTLDFAAVVLANCYGPESELSPQRVSDEFDPSKELQLRFDENGDANHYKCVKGEQLVVLSNSHLQRLGRGVDELREDELPGVGKVEAELDELAETVGGCPYAIRSAAISAKGHFVSCCGFEVEDNPILDYGNLDDESMAALIDRADNDLISNLIALLGPVKLMRILQQNHPEEVNFPRKYRTYCEVCYDLVSIPENRGALYRHSGQYADMILRLRELLWERYGKSGRIALPPQQLVTIQIRKTASATPTPATVDASQPSTRGAVT